MDRPHARPRLRVRGGAGLLLRPATGPRQGRHLGRAARRPARQPAQGTRARAGRPARRPRPPARPVPDRPALRALRGPRRHPRHDGATALAAAAHARRVHGRRRARPRRRRGRPSPTDGVRLLTEDGTRVIVRPSGTEPKVKCYLEVVRDVAPDATFDALGAARAEARTTLATLKHDIAAALGL
nr:hypothetical protein [Xylanimonas allomyrinae]